jgi:hypothetical protein
MKYLSSRFSSSESISAIVDISTIAGISIMILFTMQSATRSGISADIQQSLFVILLILILAAVNIFGNIINKDFIRDSQTAKSNINIYGDDYYLRNQTTLKFQTPRNYFDVLKTIEQIPVDTDRSLSEVQAVLLELQSYLLTEPNLSVEKRQIAMGKIQEIAIESIEHPDNSALTKLVASRQKIEGIQELRSMLISCLTILTDEPALKSLLRAIDSWKN